MEATLIDSMGSDLTVVNAARVSFNKESEWDFTEVEVDSVLSRDFNGMPFKFKTKEASLSVADQKLISYLAKHNHWTPFSHVQITLREKVPIFVARQRFKHMVGFTYNEVSRRYVDDTPEFYTPDVWRGRPINAKQGSSEEIIDNLIYKDAYEADDGTKYNEAIPIKEEYEYLIKYVSDLYQKMIENGVAPEQARMVLPQSMYTEYYVTGSLAAWARAYHLRSDSHSQQEIQDLAKFWNQVISGIKEMEYSWKALTQ